MAGLGGTVCFLLTHENSLPPVRTCQCKRLSIFVTPPKVAVPTSKTQMKSMRTLWYVFAMSENRRQYSRHIDIRCYFARELVKAVFVKLISLRTHEMVADAFCTSLPSPTFIGPGHHRVMIGQTPFALRFYTRNVLSLHFNSIFHDFSCLMSFGLPNVFYKCPHCSRGRATHHPSTSW